jgi:hypothetical protein
MHGYPRPQLQRDQWISLNGPWDFSIDPDPAWTTPDQVPFDRTIEVPYSPETPKSGIADAGLYSGCWYRRVFDAPRLLKGERLLLHFGAVDYRATIWVNGLPVMRHEGGYTPFTVDLTPFAPPASGRPSGWRSCRRHGCDASAGRPAWTAGKSASRRGSAAPAANACASACNSRAATCCSPTTPTR